MARGVLIAINILLAALIIAVAFFWEPQQSDAPIPLTQQTVGNFTLDGPSGPVSLKDYRGKLVMLYFGYTFCPDVCPTSLMLWSAALGGLTPQELGRVQPLFVSVDPERDTLPRLAEYAAFFHPKIQPATGAPDLLRRVAGSYGAVFSRQENASAGGYVVDHTSVTYLIDKAGRLVASVPHGAPTDQLLAAIRQHLPQ